MIRGKNEELYFSQYNKQYRYLDDLPEKVPRLSNSPKLPKLSNALRNSRRHRHARTKSNLDMLDTRSQIEIYNLDTQ